MTYNKRGVLYYLAGDQHWVVATVSLMSLRDHWTGPVGVMLGDKKAEVLFSRLASDERLAPLLPIRFKSDSYRRHGGYMNKPKMVRSSPFESTVFLDADTAIMQSIDPLFITPTGRVRLTRYANWVTTGRKVAGRIKKWSDVAPDLVAAQLAEELPAINTGVLAFGSGERSQQFGKAWEEMTARRPSFIADEIAAQLIWMTHGAELVDDRWNCSPIYGKQKEDVRVWHFHGKKHTRPNALPLWLPLYKRAIREDIGGIASWTPAGDRRLAAYLKKEGEE